MKALSKKVSLRCSVCGNDQFSSDKNNFEDIDSDSIVTCSDCGKSYEKDELIKENEHIINVNIDDIKEEEINEIKKSFKNLFK